MELNITKQVATIQRQSVNNLRDRYYEVFGEETQARNKQWLIKRIAWKLQANEEGDISERARRLAMEIAQSSDIRTSAPKLRTPFNNEALESIWWWSLTVDQVVASSILVKGAYSYGRHPAG